MATASREESVLKTASMDMLDAERFRVCVCSLIFGGLWITVSMLRPQWGWVSATGVTALVMSVLIGHIIVRRDALGAKFMVACLVMGFMELLADWYLIAIHQSLTYMPGGPFVWASPLYMPFAWAANLYVFGIIGRWFDGRRGLVTATVITAILGGILPPYWEFVAKYAGFWYYHDTPMLGPVPYYIIFGEFLIFGSLPITYRVMNRATWLASIGTAVIFGLWLFVEYWLGIQIFG